MLTLLLACQDYGFGAKPGPDDSPPVLEPELTLVDIGLDVAGVCASQPEAVRVQNDGEADLVVSALAVEGDGWRLGAIPVPVTVAVGEILSIPLSAGVGSATLTIRSNDTDEGLVDVPLRGSQNEGPVVFITAPAESEVLDPTVDFTLRAVTSDAEDPPERLSVAWTSVLTGDIAQDAPDSTGLIETPWPADQRASGPQVVSVRVTDRCGNTGEQTLYFCQDGPWALDTLAVDAWHTESAAVVDQAEATATLGPGVGTAFDAYTLFDSDHLQASFEVRGSGDGFTLTALDAARAGSDWIGGDGCGLGLGDCDGGTPLPGWALLFDTLAGDANDCAAAPGLSFALDGAMATRAPCVALPALDDRDWHTVTVDVLGAHLTVTVDGATLLDTDVDGLLPAAARLGFTGVGDWELRNVGFTDFTCD